MKFPLAALTVFSALITGVCAAAESAPKEAPGEATGRWLNGTIGVGALDKPLQTTALKGIAIRLGAQGEASVAYDLDLCRMAGGWTGRFVTPMNLMSRGEYPTSLGEVLFHNGERPGLVSGESHPQLLADPRPAPFGLLPSGQAAFKGFYVHGQQVVLKWQLAGAEILELPGYSHNEAAGVFSRVLDLAPTSQPLQIAVATVVSPQKVSAAQVLWQDGAHQFNALWKAGNTACSWKIAGDQLYLSVPALTQATRISIQLCVNATGGPEPSPGELAEPPALESLTHGGPANWPETVVTIGNTAGPAPQNPAGAPADYVVDTIKIPDPNPWQAPMFVGGFDFFADGRAALCTFHGDVFIVSGLDDTLQKVTWKRFASGLYHPLGLKIAKGEVFVTGRDGITRLRDLNGDGEADFYEAFNHAVEVTKSFHEFAFDLQTDSRGNFYFSKAGPVKNGGRGFDLIAAHHGCLMRVSADGSKLEVVATGFRAPNGICVGPNDELTSGDNEGTWTPACRLNWIKPGGFYGVVDLAHRTQAPTGYDLPLCWMPLRTDNSSGDQVWVTSDRWGPWKGQLLHLSYGKSALFAVLKEAVKTPAGEVMQGGVVQFPLKFQSGIMRGRFNPVDGQLYVAGLRGWQTTGLKNGAFQRVRYTGAPTRMPMALHVKANGVELTFGSQLDTQTASDPENYQVEIWNYLWSSAYGSPEISTLAPPEASPAGSKPKTRHDPLEVKSVSVSTDEKTVFLEIPGIKAVMQMSISYQLKDANGAALTGEVLNTIHALGN